MKNQKLIKSKKMYETKNKNYFTCTSDKCITKTAYADRSNENSI